MSAWLIPSLPASCRWHHRVASASVSSTLTVSFAVSPTSFGRSSTPPPGPAPPPPGPPLPGGGSVLGPSLPGGLLPGPSLLGPLLLGSPEPLSGCPPPSVPLSPC